MKTLIAILGALTIFGSAFAQNYNAAIRQAHNAVNQTQSASQGSTQPMQPPPQTPQQPMDPVLAKTLQNISNLRADFGELDAKVSPRPAFTNDLAAAATDKKVSTETIAKLAGDLRTAIAGNDELRPQYQKLAQDVHAIFNSAHLSATQQQTFEDDVQRILKNGGVPAEQVSAVSDDIKAVENETK